MRRLHHSDLGRNIGPAVTTWYAEASSLALPPGRWPESIEVEDDQGRVLTFTRHGNVTVFAELVAVLYRSPDGQVLHVRND